MTFAHRTKNLHGSSTLKIAQLCREKIAQGHEVIPMNLGESDLVVPLCVQAAAIEAIHAGHSTYADTRGIQELREKIAEKVAEQQELALRPDQVLLAPGLKQGIFYAIMSTINPGDEVIVPAPYWPSFKDMITYAGGIPVFISSSIDDNFEISAEKIADAITDKTKMIILTSPNNPTGRSISAELMREYGRVLSKHPHIWVLCDHIYQNIYWGQEPLAMMGKECPHLKSQLIILGGFTKTYAMAGWRLGYVCCFNDELMAHMHHLQMQTATHPNTITQHAAIAALNNSKQIHQEVTAAFKDRHDYLYQALSELSDFEVLPSEGAMYLFPRVTKLIRKFGLRNDCALAEYLIEHAHISIIPGSHFGLEGYIRMSFALRHDKLEKAINHIKSLPGIE